MSLIPYNQINLDSGHILVFSSTHTSIRYKYSKAVISLLRDRDIIHTLRFIDGGCMYTDFGTYRIRRYEDGSIKVGCVNYSPRDIKIFREIPKAPTELEARIEHMQKFVKGL